MEVKTTPQSFSITFEDVSGSPGVMQDREYDPSEEKVQVVVSPTAGLTFTDTIDLSVTKCLPSTTCALSESSGVPPFTSTLTISGGGSPGTYDNFVVTAVARSTGETIAKESPTLRLDSLYTPPPSDKPRPLPPYELPPYDLPSAECTDSDGGKTYDVAGTVTISYKGRSQSYTDYCLTEDNVIVENGIKVTESFCGVSKGSYDRVTQNCQYGCQNGACMTTAPAVPPPTVTVVQPTCTDSDGGKTFDVAGTVTVTDSTGKVTTYADKCSNSKSLREYYCSGTSALTSRRSCPDVCKEGKCAYRTI